MKLDDAKKLVHALHSQHLRIHSFVTTSDPGGPRIVFAGGRQGSHSLDIGASSKERVVAHFMGYLENNGYVPPAVGDLVSFPSASSPRGMRRGRISKITKTRALVTYQYKHGGAGAPKWVYLWQLKKVTHPLSPMLAKPHERESVEVDEKTKARVDSVLGRR